MSSLPRETYGGVILYDEKDGAWRVRGHSWGSATQEDAEPFESYAAAAEALGEMLARLVEIPASPGPNRQQRRSMARSRR